MPNINGSLTNASGATTSVKAHNARLMTISLQGTWTGSIVLQRSYDQGGSWGDVKTYTANIEEDIEQASKDFEWRLDPTVASGTADYYLGGDRFGD